MSGLIIEDLQEDENMESTIDPYQDREEEITDYLIFSS